MRILMALVVVSACGKDPLREDMKMFCRAVDVVSFDKHLPTTGPGHVTMFDVRPWLEQRAKTPELEALFAKIKSGNYSLLEFKVDVEVLVKKANIDSCPTLAWMNKPLE